MGKNRWILSTLHTTLLVEIYTLICFATLLIKPFLRNEHFNRKFFYIELLANGWVGMWMGIYKDDDVLGPFILQDEQFI